MTILDRYCCRRPTAAPRAIRVVTTRQFACQGLHHTPLAAERDNGLGTGLGDGHGAWQGGPGCLKKHVEEGHTTA
jgi:hypothetical protein